MNRIYTVLTQVADVTAGALIASTCRMAMCISLLLESSCACSPLSGSTRQPGRSTHDHAAVISSSQLCARARPLLDGSNAGGAASAEYGTEPGCRSPPRQEHIAMYSGDCLWPYEREHATT